MTRVEFENSLKEISHNKFQLFTFRQLFDPKSPRCKCDNPVHRKHIIYDNASQYETRICANCKELIQKPFEIEE